MLGKGKDTDIGYVIPSLVVFLKGMIGISWIITSGKVNISWNMDGETLLYRREFS